MNKPIRRISVSLVLSQLDVELQCVVGLLEAALARRPPLIWIHLPAVVQVLLPLLQSPVAAPRVKPVFLQIGVTLMPKELHYLGKPSFSYVYKPSLVLKVLVFYYFICQALACVIFRCFTFGFMCERDSNLCFSLYIQRFSWVM